MKFNLNLQGVLYLKILYKDHFDSLRHIKAAIKYIEEREILACAKVEESLLVPTPQEVVVSFVTETGLYKTTTLLKHIEKDDPYVFWSLNTPTEIEYQQNREYFRVNLKLNALISFESEDKQILQIPCTTSNISASGVCVNLVQEMNFPGELDIELDMQSCKIKSKIRFIRLEKEENTIKASFAFIELSEKDIDIVVRKCIQTQLDAKKNTRM